MTSVLIGFATIGGFLSEWLWIGDLACHFRFQYLVGLSACTILLLIARKYKRAAISMAFLLPNFWLCLPFWTGPSPTPNYHSKPLRVATANLLTVNRDKQKVLAFLRTCQAEVVVLTEVGSFWKSAIEELTDVYPHQLINPREDNFGIAIISRTPMRNATISGAGPRSVIATITWEGRPINVVGVHPVPPSSRRLWEIRNEELITTADYCRSLGGPVIVLGDMNSTSWSAHLARFLAATELRDTRIGRGIQPSWPTRRVFAKIPIDHVFVTADFIVADRRLGPPIGSDHLPVLADLWLKDAQL